jgi:hypothetical protein
LNDSTGHTAKDILVAYVFAYLHQLKVEKEKWMDVYDCHRQHQSLQYKSSIDKMQLHNLKTESRLAQVNIT